MLFVIASSFKRLSHDEVLERSKEVLVKFSLAQETSPLLSKVFAHLDEDSKARLAFLPIK